MKRNRAKTPPSSKPCSRPKPEKVPAKPPPRDPLAQILQWVLAGASERDIREAIAAIYPESDPPALLAAVMGDLEKSADCSFDVILGFCFEATRELYRRMVEIGDFPGALRAVKQIAELARNVHHPEVPEETDPANSEAGSVPKT